MLPLHGRIASGLLRDRVPPANVPDPSWCGSGVLSPRTARTADEEFPLPSRDFPLPLFPVPVPSPSGPAMYTKETNEKNTHPAYCTQSSPPRHPSHWPPVESAMMCCTWNLEHSNGGYGTCTKIGGCMDICLSGLCSLCCLSLSDVLRLCGLLSALGGCVSPAQQKCSCYMPTVQDGRLSTTIAAHQR